MQHYGQARPKKFSFLILFVLVALITGTVLMNMDIQPRQTLVEQELNESAFTQNQ